MRSGDRVAERIRKLLALSRSNNEHEAALAASRAAALMLDHRVEVIAAGGNREPVEEWCLDYGTGPRSVWRGLLAHAAAGVFGCRFYFRGSDLMLVGVESARGAVETTYRYLEELVERMASEWAPEASRRSASVDAHFAQALDAYRLGLANGIGKRLHDSRARQVELAAMSPRAGTALAVLEDEQEAVDRYVARLNLPGRIAVVRGVNTAGLEAGERASRAVNFDAPTLRAQGCKLIK